jgi:hypothetical protein
VFSTTHAATLQVLDDHGEEEKMTFLQRFLFWIGCDDRFADAPS